MTPQQPQSKDWKEEFGIHDCLFASDYEASEPVVPYERVEKLVDHFATLLAEKRSRIMRVVEGMPHINPDDINMYYTSDQKAEIRAYNQALDDIKALLERET